MYNIHTYIYIKCNINTSTYMTNVVFVATYIRERLFVEKMHQKKVNTEVLCKIWFVAFVP